MKLKVLHSPKHIAEQRTELEVGNSTPVVESENNICIENDSEGTPSHLHLSDQSYDDDSLRRHNSLCDNNLDETLGLQEDLSELKETTVKVEDQFEIEIISGKIDEIEEQEIEYMQNRHRELTILKCDCCDFNTRSYRKIEQHILKHLYRLRGEENNVVLHCPYCPNKYRQVVQVYLHLKNVHLRCYYKIYHWCVNCAKIFLSVKAVQQHFLGCLDNKIVKLFKSNKTLFCMLCDFECDNSTEAKDHRKSCRFKELTVVGDTIEID
ncbi:hypothetical protein JTB14_025383 [Gonioctena quinquepunctata]|nr:hypothetical protein JTB14_025383 [Gonioctena quinquepunctata]